MAIINPDNEDYLVTTEFPFSELLEDYYTEWNAGVYDYVPVDVAKEFLATYSEL